MTPVPFSNLLAIREALLPLLMVIPYDQLNGVHSLTAILMETVKYEAEHGNAKFVRPSRLPLYDKNIANDTTTVVRVHAEAAHKARLDDYASYEMAERGVAKFLRNVVNEIWYNDLKDANTYWVYVHFEEINASGETIENYYPCRILGFVTLNNAAETVINCSEKPINWTDLEDNFFVNETRTKC